MGLASTRGIVLKFKQPVTDCQSSTEEAELLSPQNMRHFKIPFVDEPTTCVRADTKCISGTHQPKK